MLNKLKEFNDDKLGLIRTTIDSGEAMFCLKDVCSILEIKNTSDCRSRLNILGVKKLDCMTEGGKQKLLFIDEANLYRCIFQSRKPEADQFIEWVTKSILPSIRKYGRFTVSKVTGNINNTINLLESYEDLKHKNSILEKLVNDTEEARTFLKRITRSRSLVDIADVYKELNFKGIGTKELFRILRVENILTETNKPYQEYVDKKYFKTITIDDTCADGSNITIIRTFVYRSGINFIKKILMKYAGAEIV